MSVMYCEYCNEHIDTDFNADHFPQEDEQGNPDERCINEQQDNEKT